MPLARPDAPNATPRLEFEPLGPAHAELLFPRLSDPSLFTFVPNAPPASVEALAERYARLSARLSPDGTEHWLNWVTVTRAAREPIGLLEATVLPDRSALLAWFVFTPFQSRGYASEGTRAMIAYLREWFDVRDVLADIDSRNAASIRLVDRLGFVRIVETRDADFFKGATSHEFRYRQDS